MMFRDNRRMFLKKLLALPLFASAITAEVSAGSVNAGPDAHRWPASGNPQIGALTPAMFPGLQSAQIQTSEATINLVFGGSGPPVLLLHGYPQTHAEWHKVAPGLATDFSVVIPDLRGYGDSSKPPDGDNHSGYSKRAMARDQVEVMTQLGFGEFAVVGHDRGGRVGQRLALDYPDRITKLAVLDIVPTLKLYSTVSREFATAYWHWFFLIQSSPFPETLLGNSVDYFIETFIGGAPGVFTDEARAEYLRSFRDPATIHATCEDYRAAASIDLVHDQADLDRKVTSPLLALWAEKGAMHRLYDVLETWRERADDVSGRALPGGHFLPEELPEETLAELRAFLSA